MMWRRWHAWLRVRQLDGTYAWEALRKRCTDPRDALDAGMRARDAANSRHPHVWDAGHVTKVRVTQCK